MGHFVIFQGLNEFFEQLHDGILAFIAVFQVFEANAVYQALVAAIQFPKRFQLFRVLIYLDKLQVRKRFVVWRGKHR